MFVDDDRHFDGDKPSDNNLAESVARGGTRGEEVK